MTDRNVQYPTRYRLQKIDGTDDIYEVTPVPGTVYNEGDLVNKQLLLTDDTAAALNDVASPNEALALLAKSVLQQTSGGVLTDVMGNEITFPYSNVSGVTQIEAGSYVGNGTYGISNPNSLTFGFKPKMMFITTSGAENYSGIFFFNLTNLTTSYNTYAYSFISGRSSFCSDQSYARLVGNTLYWYYGAGLGFQANNQATYYYVAIG